MAVTTKVLFLEPGEKLGNGFAAIRTYEDKLVDLGELSEFVCDSGYDRQHTHIVKDNVVYRIVRDYLDMDKKRRVMVCVRDEETFGDIYPVPEKK